MILTSEVLKLIYTELKANVGVATDFYSYFAPDEAVYPFVVFIPIAVKTTASFTKDYDKIIVQFSVFDNNVNPSKIIQIKEEIEMLFHRNCNDYELQDTNCGKHLICIHKINEPQIIDGPPNEDFFKQGDIDFEFNCQKTICCGIFSSSSMSESFSSSSSYSSSSTSSVSESSQSFTSESSESTSSSSSNSESSSSSSLWSSSSWSSESSTSVSSESSTSSMSESSSSLSLSSESSESSSSESSTSSSSVSESSSSSNIYSSSTSSSSVSSNSISSESTQSETSESTNSSSSTSLADSSSSSSSSISLQSLSSESTPSVSSESTSSNSSSSEEYSTSSSSSKSSSSTSMSSYIPYWSSSSSSKSVSSSSSSKSLSSSSKSESSSSSSESTEYQTTSDNSSESSSSEIESRSSGSSNSSSSNSSSSSLSSNSSSSSKSSSSSSLSDSPYVYKVTNDGDSPAGSPNGYYIEDGLFNGRMSYVRTDSTFYIYWNLIGEWRIGLAKSADPIGSWHGIVTLLPTGTYDPWYSTTGNPIIEDAPNVSSSSSSSQSSLSSVEYSSSTSSSSEQRTSSSSENDIIYVTGTVNPDCTGTYNYNGVSAGHARYRRVDGSYYIAWNSVLHVWNVYDNLGSAYWNSTAPETYLPAAGNYPWYSGSSGTAIITYSDYSSSSSKSVSSSSSSSKSESSHIDSVYVSGTLNPNVVGDYFWDGDYGGQDSFKSAITHDGTYWYIWYNGSWFVIGKTKGNAYGQPEWKSAILINDSYTPGNGATGTAGVAILI